MKTGHELRARNGTDPEGCGLHNLLTQPLGVCLLMTDCYRRKTYSSISSRPLLSGWTRLPDQMSLRVSELLSTSPWIHRHAVGICVDLGLRTTSIDSIVDSYVHYVNTPDSYGELVEVSTEHAYVVPPQPLLNGEASRVCRDNWAPWFKMIHGEASNIPGELHW